MKNIRTENPVTDNGTDGVAFSYEIVDSARIVFIRAESAIGADGFSFAQHRNADFSCHGIDGQSADRGLARCARQPGFQHG
jgi:hypothetical protein